MARQRVGSRLWAFKRRKLFSASNIAVPIHRNAMCVAPTFDVAADVPQHGHQTLDRVGAAKRVPQSFRQTDADLSISSSPSRIEAETPGHHDRADAPDSSLKTVNQGTALATGTLALPPLVIEGLEEFKGSFRPSVPACRESARFAIRNLKPSGLRIRDPSYALKVGVGTSQYTSYLDPTTGRPDTQIETVIATYELVEIATDKPVVNDTAVARVDYDIPGSQQRFAGQRARRDAEDRAIQVVADAIRNRLASYFVAGT